MAKTFGTGADPKGLVNRGVEGSGAAQIFRPSQAVQDFVTSQRQQGLQKQKQKQAEAKAKAERQKNLDNQFKDLLKIDIKGWTEPDNQRLLGQYGEIEKQAAELKAMGMNPFDDNDLTMKIAKFKLDMGALQDQKKLFELANTKAYTLATNKNITPEQFAEYEQNIKLYASKPFEERMLPENLALLDAPKVDVPVDTTKAIREGKGLINTVTREDPSQRTVTLVGHRQAAEQVASDPKFVKTYSAQHGIKGATPEETKKLVTDKVEEILKLGGTLKDKTTFAVGKTGKTQPQLDQNFNQWLDALRNDDLNAKSFPMEEGGTKIAVGNSTMTISGVKLDNTNLHTVVTPDGLQSVTGDYEAGITVSLKGKTVSETITEIVDGKEVERIVYKDLNEKIFIPFSDMESLKNLYYNKVNADGRLFGAQKGKEVNVNIQPPKQPTATKTVTGTPKTPQKKMTFPEWKAKNPNGTYTEYKKQNP